MSRLNDIVRQIITLPQARRDAVLATLKERDAQLYDDLDKFFRANPGAVHEALGHKHWLMKLGAQTFTRAFAPIQDRFWEWNWNALQKVQEGLPLEPRELVGFLPWPRETGKCLARDTEVLREDGTRVAIQDIQRGDRLLSINQATGRCVTDVVKRTWGAGLKDCLRIELRSGKSLTLTPEHRLWTVDGWKQASEIAIGERVAAPRYTRPKSSSTYSDAEVRLVAYMIAEGCTVQSVSSWTTRDGVINKKRSIASKAAFTNADRVIVTDFKVAAASMGFGVNQIRHGIKGGEIPRRPITYTLIGAQEWLRRVGLSGKGAHKKRVPRWVFGLPERQRWMFLAALIDTDGYVCENDGVAIALANEALIVDVSYLFTSVGVPSKVFFKPNDRRGAWVLQTSKGATRRCYERLPLLLKLDKLRVLAETNEDSILDAYPATVGRNLPKGVNRIIRNAGGPKMGQLVHPALTRSKVRRAMEYRTVPRWAWLEQADVMWDEVRSIKLGGLHATYDIQMSSTSENFIANGIVSHNSSHVEWACIAEGALLRSGYVIYLCAKLSQAIDHVVAIRDRIESNHVADLYPWLGKPKLGTHGNKFGWGQEFLMTSGGWAIRPIGADVATRGGKALNIRPTLIVPDDYDELGDSPHVVEHKEHMLTRAILPMGTANTRTLVPQNPIHPNSVVNRMLTGVSLALAMRTVFGEIEEDGTLTARPIPAVRGLVYEIRQADEGPYCEITQGESLWPDITIADWERTLNKVSPPAFEAEYQHDMTVTQEERVLPEYDDRLLRLHVVTWSQFEARYQMRRIPSDWPCSVGLDIGFTGTHKSAWSFTAKVPMACELAGAIFRYRGRSYTGMGIDDQSVAIRGELWPRENLEIHLMSHEKLGERMVLAQKHGWHFQPCDSAKTAGIAQWRHFLRPDRSQPHPFHRDEKGVDGRWKLGRPAWFDVVDDDQFFAPRDDNGLKRHRDGAFNWRQVPVKLTDKGFTVEQPEKRDDDENDSTRMCLVRFGAPDKPMTPAQKVQAIIPVAYHKAELAKSGMHPNQQQMTSELAEFLAKKTMKLRQPPLVDEFGNALSR